MWELAIWIDGPRRLPPPSPVFGPINWAVAGPSLSEPLANELNGGLPSSRAVLSPRRLVGFIVEAPAEQLRRPNKAARSPLILNSNHTCSQLSFNKDSNLAAGKTEAPSRTGCPVRRQLAQGRPCIIATTWLKRALGRLLRSGQSQLARQPGRPEGERILAEGGPRGANWINLIDLFRLVYIDGSRTWRRTLSVLQIQIASSSSSFF